MYEEAGTSDVNWALLPIPVSAAVRALARLNSIPSQTPSSSSASSSTPPTPTPSTSKAFAKQRHRHTHSLGLLTPTTSSSSLLLGSGPPSSSSLSRAQSLSSSSTSLFELSPSTSHSHPHPHPPAHCRSPYNPHPYRAQHTPLRSSTHPSPSSGHSRSNSQSQSHRPSTSASPAPSPRSSPLFQRLLQPFIRAPAVASALPTTTATATGDDFFDNTTNSNNHHHHQNENNMAALHYYQPTPPHLYQGPAQQAQAQQSSSSSGSIPPTSTPTSPPSRSERLLRDALMRDGLERNSPSGASNATSTPPSSSSSSRPEHKRRHSHVPTSSASTLGSSPLSVSRAEQSDLDGGRDGGAGGGETQRETRVQRERRREQYTGSFLFRTAMSSTSAGRVSLSPEPDHEHEHEQEEGGSDLSASMGGSGSGSGSGSGGRTGRGSGAGTTGGQSYYGGDTEGSSTHAHARSASLSPSPVRRRAGFASAAEQQQAQARWQMQLQLLDQQQHQQRSSEPRSPTLQPQSPPVQSKSPRMSQSPYSPRSPHSRRPQSQPPRDSAGSVRGSPMPMTPHEQVLRARLERVLEVGRVVQEREQAQAQARARSKSGVRGQARAHASGSGSGDGMSNSNSNSNSSIRSGSRSGSGDGAEDADARRGRSGGSGRARGGRGSESRDNEVRDEQGGWPWREKGRGSGGAEDAMVEEQVFGDAEMTASPMSLSIASLPKPAAGSSQNLSLNQEPSQQQYGSPTPTFSPRRPERQPTTPSSRTPMTLSYAPTTPSRPGIGFTPGHGRTRSKTGPPESSVPNSPSPRRNTTLMTPSRGGSSASKIPVRMDSLKLNGGESKGKNAQLEKGKQKQNTEEGCEEDGEEGELRLLTPPPTPPFTARAFPASHALSLAGQMPSATVLGEYCPSPYKSSHSASVQQQPQTPSKPSGLGKGFNGGEGPRRPANPPVSALDLPSEFAGAGVKAGRSFPASSSSASSISDGSEPHSAGDAAAFDPSVLDGPSVSPAINRLQYLQKTHQQLSEALTTRMSPSTRPAFNARKASERCRAIEGYVSFASIEGLGEPPGAAFGDDGEGGAGAGGAGGSGTGNGGGVLGAAWGGWRRLLGVAGPPGVQAQAQEEGVVL